MSDLATAILAIVGVVLALASLGWQAWSFFRGQSAEESRQRNQQSFQRAEADRTELRVVVDALAERIDGLRDRVGDVIRDRKTLAEEETASDPDALGALDWEDYARKSVRERAKLLEREIDQVQDQIPRLVRRLGDGSPLVRSAQLARTHAQSVVYMTTRGLFDPRTVDADGERAVTYCDRFLDQALPLTKAQVHTDAPAGEAQHAVRRVFRRPAGKRPEG